MTFYTRRDRLIAEVKQERASMRRRQIIDMSQYAHWPLNWGFFYATSRMVWLRVLIAVREALRAV